MPGIGPEVEHNEFRVWMRMSRVVRKARIERRESKESVGSRES